MPRSQRKPHATDSPERLIDAAIDLICERGVTGASVDAISKRAGVVKTVLYWHFGSKDGLLEAVIEEVRRVCVSEIRQAVYEGGLPLDRLDRLVKGLRNLVVERPRYLQVKQAMISERGNISPQVYAIVKGLVEESQTTIARGVHDVMGREVADADLIAHTVIALTHGALTAKLVDPEGADLERLFEDLRETVVLLITARLSG